MFIFPWNGIAWNASLVDLILWNVNNNKLQLNRGKVGWERTTQNKWMKFDFSFSSLFKIKINNKLISIEIDWGASYVLWHIDCEWIKESELLTCYHKWCEKSCYLFLNIIHSSANKYFEFIQFQHNSLFATHSSFITK